jgi:trehalose 6-phosphate phosphatase
VEAPSPDARELAELLGPLRDDPGSSGVFADIDGTLAPIVDRAVDAEVPPPTREALEAVRDRFALAGCLSGRAALDARDLVGVEGIAYIGNHGMERVLPGEDAPRLDPALDGHENAAAGFLEHLDPAELEAVGLRVEDKGPIRALHWRGAADEAAAEQRAREIAVDAVGRNLVPHWGRRVLEIRPAVGIDKGTALGELLEERKLSHVLYGGDDRTDVDAFRQLRDMRSAGDLETAVSIGVGSPEGPPELAEYADVVVDGPAGFLSLLRALVER